MLQPQHLTPALLVTGNRGMGTYFPMGSVLTIIRVEAEYAIMQAITYRALDGLIPRHVV